MKLLLFVQTGDGRPKVLRRRTASAPWKGGCVGRPRGLEFRGTGVYASAYTHNTLMGFRRWWLVQAVSTKAARGVVDEFRRTYGRSNALTDYATSNLIGRILASGGRS